MVSAVTPHLHLFPDAPSLARGAAKRIAEAIQEDERKQDRISLVLSGGNTPRELYLCLASEYRDRIPWGKVHFFWGDERFVPMDHPQSNYRMARECLLDPLAIQGDQVHPMPTDTQYPKAAARSYEDALNQFFAGNVPQFDIVLLGLGEDGHIASLFPGSAALRETEHWVVATEAPAEPKNRLTMTLPVLNSASEVFFLVSGRKKAAVLSRVLSGALPSRELPAAQVRPSNGHVGWWVDRAAAGNLKAGPLSIHPPRGWTGMHRRP